MAVTLERKRKPALGALGALPGVGEGAASGAGLGAAIAAALPQILGTLKPVPAQDVPGTPQPGLGAITGGFPYAQRPQSFAPGGPVLNFTGGSPFPVNDRVQQALAGLVLTGGLLDVYKERQRATPKPTQGGQSGGK